MYRHPDRMAQIQGGFSRRFNSYISSLLQDPKVLVGDDAEIIGHGVSEFLPPLGNGLGEEFCYRRRELIESSIALVVCDRAVHHAPEALARSAHDGQQRLAFICAQEVSPNHFSSRIAPADSVERFCRNSSVSEHSDRQGHPRNLWVWYLEHGKSGARQDRTAGPWTKGIS